jgi:membrane protein
MLSARETKSLLKATFEEWKEDDALTWGAALSYYSVLSLAPLLLILLSVAGLVFGKEGVEGQVMDQIRRLMGSQGAEAVAAILENADRPGVGSFAAVAGIVMLLLGASGVFAQLQKALNDMWEIEPAPDQGLKALVRARLLAFGIVLAIGFLLIIALVVSAGISAMATYADENLPGGSVLAHVINLVLSVVILAFLFGLIYKFLPDVRIAWKDVMVGAVCTAALFTLGKFLIGLYLGHSSVGSSYGAAGSLVVVLVWVYYSSQIFFFGAELTQVWARRYGSRILPDEHAVRAGTADEAETASG